MLEKGVGPAGVVPPLSPSPSLDPCPIFRREDFAVRALAFGEEPSLEAKGGIRMRLSSPPPQYGSLPESSTPFPNVVPPPLSWGFRF